MKTFRQFMLEIFDPKLGKKVVAYQSKRRIENLDKTKKEKPYNNTPEAKNLKQFFIKHKENENKVGASHWSRHSVEKVFGANHAEALHKYTFGYDRSQKDVDARHNTIQHIADHSEHITEPIKSYRGIIVPKKHAEDLIKHFNSGKPTFIKHDRAQSFTNDKSTARSFAANHHGIKGRMDRDSFKEGRTQPHEAGLVIHANIPAGHRVGYLHTSIGVGLEHVIGGKVKMRVHNIKTEKTRTGQNIHHVHVNVEHDENK